MASKSRSKKAPAPPKSEIQPAAALRRELKNEKRAHQAVARFRTSSRGFRGVFSGHFPKKIEEIETLAFHLAQFEAQLPNTLEAVRLARYPGAGNRNPKRMALGLCENLSVLKTHLSKSIGALEAIANGAKTK
jgi:hypothetical protein